MQGSLEMQQGFASLGQHSGEAALKGHMQTAVVELWAPLEVAFHWVKGVDLLTEPDNP